MFFITEGYIDHSHQVFLYNLSIFQLIVLFQNLVSTLWTHRTNQSTTRFQLFKKLQEK